MNKLLFRTVFFCLSVLSLYSCRQDDETERSNESGDLVAVNIPIEGVRVESADSPLTRSGSADTLTVTEDLEDGFVLETSLIPVSAGATRASITTGLASDVQILAIAYKESGELYKYQYFTPGSPIIHLPKGERFKLVFYSYNSTTKPDISRDITGSVSPVTNGAIFSKNASLNDKTESHKNNVMWGRIDLTPVITGGTTLSGVTFTHLFSRLDWQLRSVVGTITECSGRVRNTYENGTIKLGNLVNAGGGTNGNDTWIGTGSANYAAPVRFTAVGSTDITSLKTIFCPNAGQDINLAISKITVGGKTFTGQRHTFPTKLKRGVDYTAVSTIKRRMTVTFRAASGGTVTPEGPQTVDTYGSVVTSTAATNTGSKFDGWYRDGIKVTTENGVVVNNRQLMVTVSSMTEGIVYEARFVRAQTILEFSPGLVAYSNGRYVFDNSTNNRGYNERVFFKRGSTRPITSPTQMNTWYEDEGTPTVDLCKKVTANGGGWRLPTAYEWSYMSVYLDEKTLTYSMETLLPEGIIAGDLNYYGTWGVEQDGKITFWSPADTQKNGFPKYGLITWGYPILNGSGLYENMEADLYPDGVQMMFASLQDKPYDAPPPYTRTWISNNRVPRTLTSNQHDGFSFIISGPFRDGRRTRNNTPHILVYRCVRETIK